MATATACIKGRLAEVGPSLERAPEGWVYVGRACYQGGWRLAKSAFANPYPVNRYGLAGSLAAFREFLRARPELVARIRAELAGKTLCCWCADESCCHRSILREVADGGDLG
jgi:hypothetical protein